MKKSEFVKKVLKESCCLVNEAQVLHTLEIFLKLGIKLPTFNNDHRQEEYFDQNEWEDEDKE